VTLQFIACDSRNEKNVFKKLPRLLKKKKKKKKKKKRRVFISQLRVQLVACMPSETATALTSINLTPFSDDGLYICFHSASCFLSHFLSLK